MKKAAVFSWGLVTLLPLAYIVYFITYVFSTFSAPATGIQPQEVQFNVMFRMHIAAMVLIWLLIASYIVYVFRSNHVPNDKKALWAVVLFMGSIMAMPIFWFVYVWKPLELEKPAE